MDQQFSGVFVDLLFEKTLMITSKLDEWIANKVEFHFHQIRWLILLARLLLLN